ncbi:MAG: hypothetical protein FWG90_10930 [Oscillospiraceae bacterium]|nr:hypothetical protein [Oscillospiraceae bacterium]
MKILKTSAVALSLILGMSAGIGIATRADYVLPNNLRNREGRIVQRPTYPVNQSNETFGTALQADGITEYEPDLIGAEGDNGEVGYVRKSELYTKMPSSPEEALRIQRERVEKRDFSRVINVYAEDGITVLDTFTSNKAGLNSGVISIYNEMDYPDQTTEDFSDNSLDDEIQS